MTKRFVVTLLDRIQSRFSNLCKIRKQRIIKSAVFSPTVAYAGNHVDSQAGLIRYTNHQVERFWKFDHIQPGLFACLVNERASVGRDGVVDT